MGLSRAVKAGLVQNVREENKVYYEIKEAGLSRIEEWKDIKHNFWKKISLKKSGWNNYWCLVNAQIPASMEKRKILINLLKKLGFGQLSRDCFIHPFDLSRELESRIEDLNLEQYVNVFLAKICPYQNNTKLLNKLWDIEGLKKKYQEFSVKHSAALNAWDTAEDEKLITFCHSFIHDFTEIMKVDPVLPSEFLGANWEGESVLRLLDHFNRVIVPRAREVVGRIIIRPD